MQNYIARISQSLWSATNPMLEQLDTFRCGLACQAGNCPKTDGLYALNTCGCTALHSLVRAARLEIELPSFLVPEFSPLI